MQDTTTPPCWLFTPHTSLSFIHTMLWSKKTKFTHCSITFAWREEDRSEGRIAKYHMHVFMQIFRACRYFVHAHLVFNYNMQHSFTSEMKHLNSKKNNWKGTYRKETIQWNATILAKIMWTPNCFIANNGNINIETLFHEICLAPVQCCLPHLNFKSKSCQHWIGGRRGRIFWVR